MKILFFNIITLSLLFIFFSHPITIGIILLLQTLIIRLLTLIIFENSWFSYIIFLILVGGILVLFIYITRIASNEKFKLNLKIRIVILIISVLVFYFVDIKLEFFIEKKITFIIILSKFIQPLRRMIILFLIVYLLICLIAVVKISVINKGPLRQSFN